jgi:hypothetical protein
LQNIRNVDWSVKSFFCVQPVMLDDVLLVISYVAHQSLIIRKRVRRAITNGVKGKELKCGENRLKVQ